MTALIFAKSQPIHLVGCASWVPRENAPGIMFISCGNSTIELPITYWKICEVTITGSRSLIHRTTSLFSCRHPREEERLHSYPLLKSRASSPTSRYNSFASFRTSPYCQEMSRRSYLTYPWIRWRGFLRSSRKRPSSRLPPPQCNLSLRIRQQIISLPMIK